MIMYVPAVRIPKVLARFACDFCANPERAARATSLRAPEGEIDRPSWVEGARAKHIFF